MNLDLDILIVLEVLEYIVNLTQFIKCNEDTYLPLAVYWGCEQLHFPEVHFTQNFPHYFSHLPTIPDIFAIPDISIIFCSVGARVPRGFDQLIKVLRKETGRLPSEDPWGRNNNFIPASSNLLDFLIGDFYIFNPWPFIGILYFCTDFLAPHVL